MIPTIVAILPLYVQKPVLNGQWGPTKTTPLALARRVDRQLAKLSKATVTYTFEISKEKQFQARAICDGTIVAPGVFYVEVPDINQSRKDVIEKVIWKSNGKQFGASIFPVEPKAMALSTRPAPAENILNEWFSNFSKVIFSGLGRPTVHNFEKFVTSAKTQGFSVTTQGRTLVYKNRKFLSSRLILKKGIRRFEVVVDDRGNVPVAVVNNVGHNVSHWVEVNWNLRPKALDAKKASFRN